MFSNGNNWGNATFYFPVAGTVAFFVRVTLADASTQDSDPIDIETVECNQPEE